MSISVFVVKYSRLIWITILAAVGIFLFIYISKLKQENTNLNQKLSLVIIKKQGTIVKIEKIYVDSGKSTHVVIDQKANTIASQAVKDGSAIGIGLLDTVSTALKIAKDQIQQITKVNFQISSKNFLLERKMDSLTKKITHTYKNKYLEFSEVDIDSLHRVGRYTYNGDILYTDYLKKKVPIIGANHFYTDIYSTDSSFKIGSVSRLTIEHQPKDWSFKLRAGALYNINSFHSLAGGKIEFEYKRTTFTGARYYDIVSGRQVNLVGLDYTLLSF